MSKINVVLHPSTPQADQLAQINNAFRTINQENRFEVVREGVVSLAQLSINTVGAGYYSGNNDTTVTHNLGFVPVVFAYILPDSGTNRIPLNYTQAEAVSTSVCYTWSVSVLSGENEVSFRSAALGDFAAATTYNFIVGDIQYYLLRATAGSA